MTLRPCDASTTSRGIGTASPCEIDEELLHDAEHLATIRSSDGDMSNDPLPLPQDGKGAFGGDSGKGVFDRTRDFITRFVAVTAHGAIAIALWIMMCHAIDAFDCVGYLMIVSAEKGTGKTRLLEVLRLLVPRPWLIGRAPAITMALKLDRERVTLLLDETDAAHREPSAMQARAPRASNALESRRCSTAFGSARLGASWS
jgi:hypothetical protein